MIYTVVTQQDQKLPLYVTGIGHQDPQPEVERVLGYPSHQVFLITGGAGELQTEKGRLKLRTGDAVFVPKNVRHRYFPTEHPFRNRWVAFDGACAEELLLYLGLDTFRVLRCGDFAGACESHQTMYELAALERADSVAQTSAVFYRYLFALFLSGGRHEDHAYLERVKAYIQEHYRDELTLDALAALAQVSRYRLCRDFREKYQVTVFEFLQKVRIRQAKYLLTDRPDLKIKEIAAQTGFHDASYFIRTFRRYESVTPTVYRSG